MTWNVPQVAQRLVKPKATTVAAPVESSFVKGDKVRHRVFGDGVVLQVYRDNDNDKIDILFDSQGKKTLLLAYAKLEKTI